MYRLEARDRRSREERGFQSFSSTLLDKIYRSIDEGENEMERSDLRFYRETMKWKQIRGRGRSNSTIFEEVPRGEQIFTNFQRKHHHDQDFVFSSSNSSSSDSSIGGFSSSDTEQPVLSKSGARSFFPPRPKPITTGKKENAMKTEIIQSSMFYGQNEEGLIKSKSRAMKIYSNLKKVRQPISPRLGNFINSLFPSTGSWKKPSKNPPRVLADEMKQKTEQASTCSSASSHHRSCLSKNSPSTRVKPRNGDTRRVRFYPVSVIVDEDCRPCGHKRLYEEAEEGILMARKSKEEESRRVEEMAREILREFHENEMKKREIISRKYSEVEDDDAASCCSSDLFELDHLSFAGNGIGRYSEELPVYETTHLDKYLAITNGLAV